MAAQKGLQGIELGHSLVKQVMEQIQQEFPCLTQFSSLSPVPGFRDWLLTEMNKQRHMEDVSEIPESVLFTKDELQRLSEFLPNSSSSNSILDRLYCCINDNTWFSIKNLINLLKEPLLRLVVRYLYLEKRKGYAANPVAHFHLKNGATLWKPNWMGDTSPRGLNAAFGIMVNYRYFVHETDTNCRQYLDRKQIEASQLIMDCVQKIRTLDTIQKEETKTYCNL